MASLQQLEREVREIQSRNKRVEEDKRWETSGTRKILLMAFTYSGIGLYMYAIGIDRPWMNAIIPTIGFFLSTLTLPFFRSLWERRRTR